MHAEQTILDVIRSGKFVILDTETTGLDGDAEICQIAIINSAGDVLLDTLVKPVHFIPAAATAVHGITNDMVANAPAFPLDTIYELIAEQNVIVYNVDYDQRLLYQSVAAASMFTCDWAGISNWYCAMTHFAEVYGDWNDYHGNYRWQTLHKACVHYGIPLTKAHSALDDALATLEVCRAMARQEVK